MANEYSGKVGSYIKNFLKKFRIRPHVGCSCYSLAEEMDRVGPDVVEKEIDSYTDKMYESIKDWRRTRSGLIPVPQPPRIVIYETIQFAILMVRE